MLGAQSFDNRHERLQGIARNLCKMRGTSQSDDFRILYPAVFATCLSVGAWPNFDRGHFRLDDCTVVKGAGTFVIVGGALLCGMN